MLKLPVHLAKGYKSASQIARVTTEAWVEAKLRCPSCGASLNKTPPNERSVDFICSSCSERFQLKSFSRPRPAKLPGGEYNTTIQSLVRGERPSFVLLRYDRQRMCVIDVYLVHSAFITESAIEPRKPLSTSARRSGWQGCFILLDRIPADAYIPVIVRGARRADSDVRARWIQAKRLTTRKYNSRRWISTMMMLLEKLDQEFTLSDVYGFEKHLSTLFPNNKHIRAKIRQQLQCLRDDGYIKFLGRGRYRKVR